MRGPFFNIVLLSSQENSLSLHALPFPEQLWKPQELKATTWRKLAPSQWHRLSRRGHGGRSGKRGDFFFFLIYLSSTTYLKVPLQENLEFSVLFWSSNSYTNPTFSKTPQMLRLIHIIHLQMRDTCSLPASYGPEAHGSCYVLWIVVHRIIFYRAGLMSRACSVQYLTYCECSINTNKRGRFPSFLPHSLSLFLFSRPPSLSPFSLSDCYPG